jgi:Concanavalin A-like lectin/glucanases superfamily
MNLIAGPKPVTDIIKLELGKNIMFKKIFIATILGSSFVINAAEWPMNEASGQVLKEKFGEKAGFLGDSPAKDKYDAVRQKAPDGSSVLLFDGLKQHATIPDNKIFDFSKAKGFTLEVQVKPLSGLKAAWGRIQILCKGADSGANSYQLTYHNIRGKSNLIFFIKVGKKKRFRLMAPAKLPIGQWSTITVTADRKNLKMYLDGKEIGSAVCNVLPQRNRSPLKVGTYVVGIKFSLKGYLRNLKILPEVIVPEKPVGIKQKVILQQNDFARPGSTKSWHALSGTWTRGKNGYQEFSDQGTIDGYWTVTGAKNWENYTFSTSASFHDSIGAVMLGFCRRDQKNMYVLEFRRSEMGISLLKLYLIKNGKRSILYRVNSSSSKLPDIKKNGKVTLQVDRYNKLIVASVNGRPVFCVENDQLTSGGAGLGVNNRKVRFTQAEVIQYPDYIAPIQPSKIAVLALKISNPYYRHVFIRGEKIPLKVSIINNSDRQIPAPEVLLSMKDASQFKQNLKIKNISPESSGDTTTIIETSNYRAGEYTVKAISRIGNRKLEKEYRIELVAKPRNDRFHYRSWAGNFTKEFLRQLHKNGFNGTMTTIGLNSNFQELRESLADFCDTALKYGISVKIQFPSNGQAKNGRKDTLVHRKDGTRGTLPDPHHPDHRKWSTERLRELANIIKHYPAIDELMLTSENENRMEMSYSPEAIKRTQKELGFPIPDLNRSNAEIDGVKGSVLKVSQSIKDKTPVVFPDTNQRYTFLKWFWQRGFGDNTLNAELHRELKKIAPHIETTHDPFRDVALFKRNKDLDSIGSWFYCHPGPGETLGTTEMLIAQSKGEPHRQKIVLGPSLFLYAHRIGPATGRWAGVQPTDIIMESLWLTLSRRPDGLEHFTIRFLLPGSNPEHCPKNLLSKMKKFSETVLQPLWPMLTRLERPQKNCAMLVSFGSRVFGDKIWGGFGGHTGNGYYDILQKAHIPTDMVFDETIQQAGLNGYKILFMHNTKHLPESVYKKIVDFAKKGGKVVCGQPLSKMIPNALDWDPDMSKYKKSTYYAINKTGGATADQIRDLLNNNARFIHNKLVAEADPFADSPSTEIYLNTLENDGVKYVFAVNDKRDFGEYFGKKYRAVLDKGLPLQATIRLNTPNPVIYDLLQHTIVTPQKSSNKSTFKINLPSAGGNIFAVYDRPISSIKIVVPKAIARGNNSILRLKICDAKGNPMAGTQPLKVTITSPDGAINEFSGYYATDKGQCRINFSPALNEPGGKWKIVISELSSGLKIEKTLIVK